MRIYKVLPLFLLFAGSLPAQTFEGTIRWTMKMEVTDPKMKAQMEQAQQQMNDPAKQRQLRQMQEQMNSPEMKKMMESNPQMKAQMESAMMAAGGGVIAMMPTSMMVKIKGANMVSIMEGGMGDKMEILYARGKPVTRVNRSERTYSKMPEDQAGSTNQAKVTKTAETTIMLGYTCTKSIAEVMERGTVVKQVFWTTTEIKDMDMKSLVRQRTGQGGQAMYYDQMEGVPLKMEFSSADGNMVMEVTEIKRQKLTDADFVIPADFKEAGIP